MDVDPWTVTVAVITICVVIVVVQWLTFQKKLKASSLKSVSPVSAVPSPVSPGPAIPAPVSPGPAVPAPVSLGPTAPAPVSLGPAAPAPVSLGPAVPAPVSPGPAPPAPASPGPTAPVPVSPGSAAPAPVVPSSAAPAPVVSSSPALDSKKPPPKVVQKALPEVFDQTFTEYGAQYGMSVVDRHRQVHPGCRFICRTIRNCLPKDMVSAKSISPNYDRFLYCNESTRIYYLHVPEGVVLKESEQDFTEYGAPTSKKNRSGHDKGHHYPVVIFLHDKDETCFDGELIEHPNKTPSQSWLDLSDEQGIILVFAQARGQWINHKSARREEGDPLKTFWLPQCFDPNQLDQVYLENVLDDLREICSQVDLEKIYLTGYVNGGFMASDVTIGCTLERVVNGPYFPWLKYPLAAVCLYMGGITTFQIRKTLNIDKYYLPNAQDLIAQCDSTGIVKKKDKNNSHKPDVLIITSSDDPEIFSCVHAVQCFYHLGHGVKLINMPDRVQGYYPDNTVEIWKFFQQSPHL